MVDTNKYIQTKAVLENIFSLPFDEQYAVTERIQQAVTEELEVDFPAFLCAYYSGNVNAMVEAITGWPFYDLLIKAKVIPDEKHTFYSTGEVNPSELTFPEGISLSGNVEKEANNG